MRITSLNEVLPSKNFSRYIFQQNVRNISQIWGKKTWKKKHNRNETMRSEKNEPGIISLLIISDYIKTHKKGYQR